MDRYEKVSQVGEGTYGKVYKARKAEPQENTFVAMKTIRMETEKEGFPVTAVREIKLLKMLNHENIIKIKDIVANSDGVSLVFDYLEHDLAGLLQHPSVTIGEEHVRYVIRKLLRALEYMHSLSIVHRDLKTSNILIGREGEFKLADFGLAKSMPHPDRPSDEHRIMTNRVVTLWYRPLELLLGATEYGPEVDMWGVGCVLVEMFTKKPLFAGSSEISQIEAILKRFPDTKSLPEYPWKSLVSLDVAQSSSLDAYLRDTLPKKAADLALRLLQLDPKERMTAKQALKHDFFVGASSPILTDLQGDWHEYESKLRKKTESVASSAKQ